jgi:dimethylaniline monooxygenase (N-oxide forming)
MASYVNMYADAKGIRQHIVFHRKVISLHRDDTDELWATTAESTDQVSKLKIYKSRFVAIATGHHVKPLWPKFDGEETFPGRIIHSVDYKSAEINEIAGKRLLVVGIGNSAVDVASDAALSGHCDVILSTRSGAWILPNYVIGHAIDLYACRLALWLPWQILNSVMEAVIRLISGHPRKWGLNPKMRPLQTQPTVSSTLIHCIQRGYVKVKPNILRINRNEVVFTDGSTSQVDHIVVCTGYNIDLPFLSQQLRNTVLQEGTNVLQLYKNVFDPEVGHSLAFIGFLQPASGGILTCSETQARWFVELCKGTVHLPPTHIMKSAILQERERAEKRYYASARHTIQRDPIIYNDEIASMFGARPSFWRHPLLAWRLLFGSGGSAQWRLQGPGKWNEADKAVRRVPVTGLMAYSTLFIFVLFTVVLYGIVWFLF